MNNDLIPLTEVLNTSSQQLRSEWCEQLLYKLHIIHNGFQNAQCNICLSNLMVDRNNDLVVVNVSEKPSIDIAMPNNTKFKAPELINKNIRSKAGDVWATGICIYFINNLCFPWRIAANNDKTFYSWANEGIFPTNLNNSYLETVQQMLCVDPALRPSIRNVIKETYCCKIDENGLSKLLYFNKLCCLIINFCFIEKVISEIFTQII